MVLKVIGRNGKSLRAFGDRGWVHFTAIRHNTVMTVKITKAAFVDDLFCYRRSYSRKWQTTTVRCLLAVAVIIL